MLDMDKKEIKIGDYLGFKDGIEQSGRCTGLSRGLVEIAVWDDMTGESVPTLVSPNRCWHE